MSRLSPLPIRQDLRDFVRTAERLFATVQASRPCADLARSTAMTVIHYANEIKNLALCERLQSNGGKTQQRNRITTL